ncbi:hypothetical protein WA577_002942 [Blastocystis sp. JDR]
MHPSSSTMNSILQQQLQGAGNTAEHVVVMPDQMPFMMPPSLPIGMNNNMSSSRSNVVAVQTQSTPMNILSYPDSNVSQGMGGEGGMNSAVVTYSYIANDSLPYHQTDMQMGMLPMDNIQENQEYINPQEYGSMPLNTQNFSLKPPKRLMSAYACFSRKVFNDVKATMPPQSKQSDIFREIAKKWKGMSPEEKQPYVNEANEDKKRKKDEEQQYNRFRRDIEKGYEIGGNSLLRLTGSQGGNHTLQTLFAEHDAKQMALFFLNLNECDLKGTIDVVRETINLISTTDLSQLYDKNDPALLVPDTYPLSSDAIISSHGTPQYKCTYPGCNKVFNWKSNLNVHMRTHEVNRPRDFVCPEPNCGKKFYDQQHLKQHLQIHKRTPNSHVCPYPGCTKKYSTPGGLKLHIKSHHQIDKKYKCDVPGCDKAFVRRTDLKIHKLRVHSDSKPFVCHFSNCDKSYVSQSELNRHMQTHKYNDHTVPSIVA